MSSIIIKIKQNQTSNEILITVQYHNVNFFMFFNIISSEQNPVTLFMRALYASVEGSGRTIQKLSTVELCSQHLPFHAVGSRIQ